MNTLRERWLNPPEWTRVEYLEFPATADGPWARYVECGDSSPLSPPDRLVGQAERRSAARGTSGAPVSRDGDKSPRESGDESPHSKIGLARYPRLVPKDAECAVKLKKRTLTNLYNERPAWLDLAHKKLDAAVAAAYGWSDLAEVLGPNSLGFYDFKAKTWELVDLAGEKEFIEILEKYEKECDEQILERLLALNLERAAEEQKAAKVKKPKASREKRDDEMV